MPSTSTEYPFCPVHGVDWKLDPDTPGEVYCPVCTPKPDTVMISVVLSQDQLAQAKELGHGDPADGVRYALASVEMHLVRSARRLLAKGKE